MFDRSRSNNRDQYHCEMAFTPQTRTLPTCPQVEVGDTKHDELHVPTCNWDKKGETNLKNRNHNAKLEVSASPSGIMRQMVRRRNLSRVKLPKMSSWKPRQGSGRLHNTVGTLKTKQSATTFAKFDNDDVNGIQNIPNTNIPAANENKNRKNPGLERTTVNQVRLRAKVCASQLVSHARLRWRRG